MSVEINSWRTRCNNCRTVYGEYWDTEEEARAYDEEGDGLCAECVNGTATHAEGSSR